VAASCIVSCVWCGVCVCVCVCVCECVCRSKLCAATIFGVSRAARIGVTALCCVALFVRSLLVSFELFLVRNCFWYGTVFLDFCKLVELTGESFV
jgi:ABC-type Fe3+-siderophore transport system permease subunit